MFKRAIQLFVLAVLVVVLVWVLPVPVRQALVYAVAKAWERLEWLALRLF